MYYFHDFRVFQDIYSNMIIHHINIFAIFLTQYSILDQKFYLNIENQVNNFVRKGSGT